VPSLDDLGAWLERHRKRFGVQRYRSFKSALVRLAAARREGEPTDLTWFLSNLRPIANRLDEVSKATAISYACRVRKLIVMFDEDTHGRERRQIRPFPDMIYVQAVAARPLTPQEQLGEALTALSRWPALWPYLLDPLKNASAAIDGVREEYGQGQTAGSSAAQDANGGLPHPGEPRVQDVREDGT
jgi:hypothetical protein